MKRAFVILIFILGFLLRFESSEAAITAVSGQDAGAFGDNTTGVDVAFPGDVTGGNLVVLHCGKEYIQAGGDVFIAGDVVKSAGTATIGTVTLDATRAFNVSSNFWFNTGTFSVPVTGSGSLTMRCEGAVAGSFLTTAVQEFSGVDISASRAEDTSVGGASGGTVTSGDATSTDAALFVGSLSTSHNADHTITPDVAFTEIFENESVAHHTGSFVYQIVGAGTTDAADWTLGTAGIEWNGLVTVYKEAFTSAIKTFNGLSNNTNLKNIISAVDGANNKFSNGISSASIWTIAGTPTAQTTVKRTGSEGSFESAATASTSYIVRAISSQHAVMGFWFMFDDLPAADVTIASFGLQPNNQGRLNWDSATGKMFLSVDSVGKTEEGPVIAADTWYWVDLYYNSSADPHTMDWRITEDGDTPGANLTRQSDAATAITLNNVRAGIGVAANNTGTIYISDIVLSTTAADYPIGPMEIEVLRPNGDGTHNASAATDFLQNNTTNIDPATTTAYDFINDDPIDADDTDNISIAAAGSTEYLEFTLENTARSDAIVGIQVVRRQIQLTGTNSSNLRLVDGASTANNDLSVTNETQFFIVDHATSLTKPTGGVWTEAAVNDLKVRWLSSDISPVPSLHAFYVGVVRVADYLTPDPSLIDTINGLLLTSVKSWNGLE